MYAQTEKPKKNKSQSVANTVSQKQSDGESTFQFVDNRPESIAQKKLQEMANDRPRGTRLKSIQGMTNNSSHAKRPTQLQTIADNNSVQQQSPIQQGKSILLKGKANVNDNIFRKNEATRLGFLALQQSAITPRQPAPISATGFNSKINVLSQSYVQLMAWNSEIIQRVITIDGTATTIDALIERLKNGRRKEWIEKYGETAIKKLLEQKFDGKSFKYKKFEKELSRALPGLTALDNGKEESKSSKKPEELSKLEFQIWKQSLMPTIEKKIHTCDDSLTEEEVKHYLSFNESESKPLVRGICIEIRSRTYQSKNPQKLNSKLIGQCVRAKQRLYAERDKDNIRGVPKEYHEGELREMSKERQEELVIWIGKRIPNIAKCKSGSSVVNKLATDPIFMAYAFLMRELVYDLFALDPFWDSISLSGQESFCTAIIKINNNGDVKGVLGEIRLALDRAKQGIRNINVGTEEELPVEVQKQVGKKTQEVDISYAEEGGMLIFAEAKYDMKTFIQKYNDFDKELGKSKQQRSYEGVREKANKEGSGGCLMFFVANPHDWLLLFIPGGSGLRVLESMLGNKWIVNIAGTVVLPEKCLLIKKKVNEFCNLEGIEGSKRENWAEAFSIQYTPLKIANLNLSLKDNKEL